MDALLLLLSLVVIAGLAILILSHRLAQSYKHCRVQESLAADQARELTACSTRMQEVEAGYAESLQRIAGLTEAYRVASAGQAVAEARLEEERKASAVLKQQLDTEVGRAGELEKEVKEVTGRLAKAETKIEEMQTAMAEKLALLHDAERKLADSFAALASKALQENNDAFMTLAKTQLEKAQAEAGVALEKRQQEIDRLVTPISESLAMIDKSVKQIELERAESFQSIKDQLQRVTQETGSLSRALRQPSSRGQWGEMQLKNVVELAGLQEHCDFSEQTTLSTDRGDLRPDMIVRMPDEKTIVIDSKVPLYAYLEAMEADDPSIRAAKLEAHARQTRSHVEQLGKKAYWSHLPSCPDFVICFLPSEALFSAALKQDPSLPDFSASRNVLLVSPTILIAVLKGVAYGWRQKQLAQSAQEISSLGATLYDRVRVLAEHFVGIQKGLDRAVKSYNSAVGTLESRVLVTARQFAALGTDSKEAIESPGSVDRTTRLLSAPELVHHLACDSNGVTSASN